MIALDAALADAGGPPLDLIASGTLRAELLVGDEGAAAIAKARASALESRLEDAERGRARSPWLASASC